MHAALSTSELAPGLHYITHKLVPKLSRELGHIINNYNLNFQGYRVKLRFKLPSLPSFWLQQFQCL